MNESIGSLMKSGFPFLLLVVLAMLIVSLWRREDRSKNQKIGWTIGMIGPVLLTGIALVVLDFGPSELLEGLILGKQPFSPPIQPFAFKMLVYSIFFLPFSGILAWLLVDR